MIIKMIKVGSDLRVLESDQRVGDVVHATIVINDLLFVV